MEKEPHLVWKSCAIQVEAVQQLLIKAKPYLQQM